MDELVSLIETLAERIGRHRDVLGKNEMHTRMALVDPLLRALGWDTSDPQVVSAEYTVPVQGAGRADYALLGDDAKPVATIEAKKLGEPLDQHVLQTLNYANAEGIPYAGSTDGNHWHLYDVFGRGGPIQDRRILEVQLAEGPAVKCALSLLMLWKPNLLSSDPMPAPQPAQPSTRAPQAPSPPASTPNDRTNRSTLADFNPETETRLPVAVWIPGADEKQISNQKELLCAVAEGLMEAGKLTTGNGTLKSGRVRYIVHNRPRHQNGEFFHSQVKLGKGLYIETHNSFVPTVEYAKRLVEHCGMDTGQVELRW